VKGVRGRVKMRVMARKKKGPPPGFVPMTDEEFEDELVRRMEDIVSGKVKTIPLDEAWRQIHEARQRRRGGR
jgi:hypothetical protein